MYAYFALHKFHWEPSRIANLPMREKALVIAIIRQRLEDERKEQPVNWRGHKKRYPHSICF